MCAEDNNNKIMVALHQASGTYYNGAEYFKLNNGE